ncbi:polysaccharide deacetylase family protein [Streptomyces gamaensis]|uniref:Polysaccharide deacetylase family protein n=1 Tax=Streptomyces gamaensis TaxID=1763542 RepID=A0ABW0Z0M6_9ACTN
MRRFPATLWLRTTLPAVAAAVALTGFGPAPAVRPSAPPPCAATPAPALYGGEVRRLPTQRRVVALTFNAAWNEDGLADVLRVLRDKHAPATFFPTGQFAERHPRAVRAMAAAGHGIGSHSHSHPHFSALTPAQARHEVLRAHRALRAAAGTCPLPFFRFPYSETTPQRIAEVNGLGFADIEFSADTNGYKGPGGGMSTEAAVRRALDALGPGEIVQMHVGTPDGSGTVLDARALPRIIDAVRERGYRITDLREHVRAAASS